MNVGNAFSQENNRKAIAELETKLAAATPRLNELRLSADAAKSEYDAIAVNLAEQTTAPANIGTDNQVEDDEDFDAEGDDDGDGILNGNEEIVVTGTRRAEEIVKPRSDHRIRISAFSRTDASIKEQIYGPRDRTKNILEPLWETDGLLFPYTPTISISQDTSWQIADLEQVNYDILSFQKSSSATISINGKFTVQNQREGRYLLAVIHFLRTVSKAYFGASDIESFDPPIQQTGSANTPEENAETQITRQRQDGRAGLPPPVLLFSGYGDMMFNDVRVVVRSHSWSYDENADLVRIDLPTGGTVWLPPLMTITISLSIQQNTDRLRDTFNLDEFRTGALLKKRGWF
jgi:hypothetical protein